MEKLDKPPPLIILNISKKPNSWYKAEAQGIVIPVPRQKIPKHIKVKYIFFLKSLLLLLNSPLRPLNI